MPYHLIVKPTRGRAVLRYPTRYGPVVREWRFDPETPELVSTLTATAHMHKAWPDAYLVVDVLTEDQCVVADAKIAKKLTSPDRPPARPSQNGRIIKKAGGL